MIAVLDTSAAVAVALNREGSEKIATPLKTASKVITSELFKAETQRHLSYCEMLIDEFVEISKNNKEALLEGLRLKHSVYDLLYFTLARRHGAVLLTLDKKLRELARQNGIALAD